MWNKHLHIVSLNIPLPANYGGVIDIWYKIKALAENGIKIHLHCFVYGRQPVRELEDICYSVNYYNRHTGLKSWFSAEPYIVKSRDNIELLQNLTKFDAPILFEGIHSTHFIENKMIRDRIKIVRAHNVEHDYYNGLQKQERNLLKKIYFWTECQKLKRYEQSALHNAQLIAAISPNDTDYFLKNFENTILLPAFHPNKGITAKTGMGQHILYHADLSVPENIKAAIFIVNSLTNIQFPIVIAGRNPSKEIQEAIIGKNNIRLIANPVEQTMNELIADAHIIALPTFQPTGIKLKLIESLYKGRHCVANSVMVEGTRLEDACHLANNADDFQRLCKELILIPFNNEEIEKRKAILANYDTTKNALALIHEIDSLMQ